MPTPIVLVPGLNCTAEVYAGQVPALWQFGPVHIANHLRGETMAEIAAAILADAPPRFALAGFSMGGYIVFEMLRQAPERITRLALIDTMARPDTPERIVQRNDGMRLAQAGKLLQLSATNFPNAVHPDNVNRADVKAIALRMAEQNGPEVYVRHVRAILFRADFRPDLPGITVPTTVIVGEADLTTPVDASHEMADTIPGANLALIAGAGHMAPFEQPAAVTQAMVGWLKR